MSDLSRWLARTRLPVGLGYSGQVGGEPDASVGPRHRVVGTRHREMVSQRRGGHSAAVGAPRAGIHLARIVTRSTGRWGVAKR